MTGLVTPVKKVGNLLVRPNWRYEALFNPTKYKLKEFASKTIANNAGCLKRFVSLGLPFEVNYKMTPRMQECYDGMSPINKEAFKRLWERHIKRNRIEKISIDSDNTIFQKSPLWNMKKLNLIGDKFLIRLIKHHSNVEHDASIAYALELGKNSDYTEIYKFIGYCIYAKVEDAKIAVRWNIPVKHVEALRLLFYDFSTFPKDRLANISHLRQLANTGLFTDVDFAYFKRVFELGELGLKAQTDFYNLSTSEKKIIEEYLGKTIVSNTLNMHFAIRNQRDAVDYGLVISNLASYHIKVAEATYFSSKIRNLDASTRRIEGDLAGTEIIMTDIDKEFMLMLDAHSLHDDKLEYKTLDMLE